MGNWIPSVGRKRTPNGVSATSSATKNGKISTAENDEATTAGSTTTAGEVGDQQQSPHLNIYRSLSNIDEAEELDTKPNFRLLRRSFIVDGHRGRQGLPALNDEYLSRNSWTTRTLPGSFGRARSSASSAEDGEVVLRQRPSAAPVKSRRRPASLCSTTETRIISSVRKTRPVSALVTIDEDLVEFPDCNAIRRRTAAFQRRFVEHFMTIYSSLPASVQTSALSVAVRLRSVQSVNHVDASSPSSLPAPDVVVSLHQYLAAAASCDDVPLQLPASEYALTVSPDHFDLVRRARVDGGGGGDLAALARLIVADVAAEAAAEIGRAFEYQLVALGDEDGLAARVGARRAAERAMDYLKRTSNHVDVNSLTRGVVDGRPSSAPPPTVSAIFGQRCELHWNVDDLFCRPGLRRERVLVAGGVDSRGGYGIPWRFYASSRRATDATLYGYRAQLLVRDFHADRQRGGRQPTYRLDVDEETEYDVEVPWRLDDFHRTYRPYRRLVGSAVMASYAALSDDEKTSLSLNEFVQQLQGDAFRRDEVEPVFRPLTTGSYLEHDRPVGIDVTLAKPDSAPATLSGFRPEEFTQRPTSIVHYAYNTSVRNQSTLSDAKNCRNESIPIPTKSSAPKSISPTRRHAELVHDRTAVDQVVVSSIEPPTAAGDVSVSGTNSTTDAAREQSACAEANQPVGSTPAAQLAVRSFAGDKRRALPPPVVKPKPSFELRRQMSTPVDGSCTMTSLPVARRQSSMPADERDSTQEVTVRFPTLEELFGLELAAMRHDSTDLSVDNSRQSSSALLPRRAGSNATSVTEVNDAL